MKQREITKTDHRRSQEENSCGEFSKEPERMIEKMNEGKKKEREGSANVSETDVDDCISRAEIV